MEKAAHPMQTQILTMADEAAIKVLHYLGTGIS
jgi:hypothetical protein